MAVDQYGNTYHNLGKYPRKALLERLFCKHVDKMYVDRPEGPKHVGYIIGAYWLQIYVVAEWSK
tara:strand:- start:1431 stop:1622 length:192 start_codon:yes stop_codon:yes gene_type:complete